MLNLTMNCGPYDRARALIDKRVVPDGINLEVTVNRANPGKMTSGPNGPFDVFECYTGQYMLDLPHRTMGYTAIPVFVKRMFRHSYIYINKNAGISSPADLNGRRIGLQHWSTSAGVWARGILEDEHGLDVASVTWVVEQTFDTDSLWTKPPWLKLEKPVDGSNNFERLVSGDIQALITTAICAPDVHPDIDFLFPNHGELERDYFKRTGFFPIMHTLLVRTDLLEREPWVAISLFDAWMASKRLCYEELEWQRVHMTALWYRELHEEQLSVAGSDFYVWGFRRTRNEVKKMLEYVRRYGMLPRDYEPEELFHPTTLLT
jgi:4,5-dihydroxyphthalate decarboxylase